MWCEWWWRWQDSGWGRIVLSTMKTEVGSGGAWRRSWISTLQWLGRASLSWNESFLEISSTRNPMPKYMKRLVEEHGRTSAWDWRSPLVSGFQGVCVGVRSDGWRSNLTSRGNYRTEGSLLLWVVSEELLVDNMNRLSKTRITTEKRKVCTPFWNRFSMTSFSTFEQRVEK